MDSIILKSILKTNPEILRENAEVISTALTISLSGKGLLSSKDLKFVTVQHLLAENLNEFQALRLLDFWKTGGHLESDQQPTSSSSGASTLIVPIPWDFIWKLDKLAKTDRSGLAIALLKEFRRPSASAELLLVNAMVAAAKEACPSAKREIMEPMAKAAASLYPKSFTDTVGGTCLGYKRFLKHCKDQHDNYDPRPCRNKDKADKFITIVSMPVKAVIGLSKESWHNTDLPPGETEESQEDMRQEMLKFAGRKKEKDTDKILDCVKTTYPSQRAAILKQYKAIREYQNNRKRKRTNTDQEPEMTDLLNDWPYLFRGMGLVLHFNTLYNIDLDNCLHLYFDYNAAKMLEFLIAKQGVEGNQVNVFMQRAIEKEMNSVYAKMLGLLMLLAKAFKEDISSFILNVEPTTQMKDVAELENLPSTPCIIACGNNTFGAKKFYVTMDKFCLMATSTFKDAFRAAYSLFFVFHIDFPRKFGLVCEFIQREILNVNSDVGSKRAEANGAAPISAKLVSLQREYDEYHRVMDAAKASLEEGE